MLKTSFYFRTVLDYFPWGSTRPLVPSGGTPSLQVGLWTSCPSVTPTLGLGLYSDPGVNRDSKEVGVRSRRTTAVAFILSVLHHPPPGSLPSGPLAHTLHHPCVEWYRLLRLCVHRYPLGSNSQDPDPRPRPGGPMVGPKSKFTIRVRPPEDHEQKEGRFPGRVTPETRESPVDATGGRRSVQSWREDVGGTLTGTRGHPTTCLVDLPRETRTSVGP